MTLAPQPPRLIFLKLGGSLITNKNKASVAKPKILARLAKEIAQALKDNPDLRLVLGHGSGSFGHMPAKKYGTRDGVYSPEEWRGFAEIWYQASALTRIVIEALHEVNLPVVAFPAVSSTIGKDGKPVSWDLTPIQIALNKNLLPLVYGDVVFDTVRGGTIFSTEDIFNYLARHLAPMRILLAGIEPGVWADYPECTQIIETITPNNLEQAAPALSGSAATDVTGGMVAKVNEMLALTQKIPSLEIVVFSGKKSGNLKKALAGETIGTTLKQD